MPESEYRPTLFTRVIGYAVATSAAVLLCTTALWLAASLMVNWPTR